MILFLMNEPISLNKKKKRLFMRICSYIAFPYIKKGNLENSKCILVDLSVNSARKKNRRIAESFAMNKISQL